MRHILDYYPIAMAEGEGAGTAYEYYVKARALRKVLAQTGQPKSLLILGLPERYGFSFDFLLLAQDMYCQRVLVIDERPERMERFKQGYNQLITAGVIKPIPNLEFADCPADKGIGVNLNVAQGFSPAGSHNVCVQSGADLKVCATDKCLKSTLLANKGEFDLFISCEVLQRLAPNEQPDYWKAGLKSAKAGVVFTPNADNPDHAAHSGLKTVNIQTMRQQAQAAGGEILIDGYLDLPPFPPGIKRSDKQRESAGQGLFRLAFWGIEQWAKLENCFSLNYRKKSAHIVFVAAKRG
ncbi:MAG: hypothetical protein HZA78_08750 [Candidatus Schekmanbacteria bacterium]|nr:hypothetical protein [Candidatus Schekmanbacteria bacterium]